MARKERSRPAAEGRKQREIQRKVDAEGRTNKAGKPGAAMQAGARLYPESPFPRQHHVKPGKESAIEPAPLYDALLVIAESIAQAVGPATHAMAAANSASLGSGGHLDVVCS